MEKEWYKSKTLASLLVTVVGIFAPKYAPFVSETAGDILALIGAIGAIVGRVVADKKLTVKKPEPEIQSTTHH